MAFYTSRVDDNGNELERRQSARSLATLSSSSSTHLNLSSRSCDTKSSVRYVNSAAFIEKNSDTEHKEQSDDLGSISAAEQTISVKGHVTASENQSDIVPPLDLQSEENYPTTRDFTYSYRKHCEAAKIVLKPDLAYETWLSAKRKLLSDEAARRKKAEEQKVKEQESRKQLAKEKFQQWLETKARKQTRSREKLRDTPTVESDDKLKKTEISEVEAQAKVEEWERIKQLEEEQRRMLKRQQEEERKQLEEQRRKMAAEAWNKWLSEADKKPKPVPLNQGIFTLRGTISDIFVNPNEWQTATAINDD